MVADVDTASPNTLFVHADHLDRPVRMTNAAQALVWDAVYKPYGEVQSITGSASLDARFPGQWFQLETGLHHNWHRTYDPTTGRYLQPDPLGNVDGPSVYAYANSSPMMLSDPEGLIAPGVAGVLWGVRACAGNLACSSAARYAAQQIIDFCMGKRTGKEKSNDVPSWVEGEKLGPDEDSKQKTKDLLEKQYPNGVPRVLANQAK